MTSGLIELILTIMFAIGIVVFMFLVVFSCVIIIIKLADEYYDYIDSVFNTITEKIIKIIDRIIRRKR